MATPDRLVETAPHATRSGRWTRQNRRRHRRLVDGAFVVYVVAVAVFRFLVLREGGAPPTIDAGNWLAFGEQLFGDGFRSGSIVYPPVVPTLVAVAVRTIGPTNGVAALGALCSILPGTGCYVVLRRMRIGWCALPLGALLVGASSIGEATAWGGFPQLIGLGLVPGFLWLLDRMLLHGGRGVTAGAAATALALTLTSHFAAVFAATAAVVLVVLRLLTSDVERRRVIVRCGSPRLALVAVPSLLAFPLYVPLLTSIGSNSRFVPASERLTASNLADNVDFVIRDLSWAWRAAIVVALLVPLLLLDLRRTRGWTLATASMVAVAATSLITREPRYLYFLPLAVVLSLAALAEELRVLPGRSAHRTRLVTAALLVVMAIAQTITGARYFSEQRSYYGILTPGMVQAIDWVAEHVPPSARIGVSTVDDAPLGWWVEGLAHRTVDYASPLRWLSFDDEIRRARRTNEVFGQDFPSDEALQRARRAGIAYLLVAKNSSRYSDALIDDLVGRHPRVVAYENPGAIVLRTGPEAVTARDQEPASEASD